MKNRSDLNFELEKEEGSAILETIKESRKGLFLVVLGNTEIAKIPQISAAGKYPEFTDFTPAADAELLLYGSCKCIDGIPITPEGIPTPAIITRSALKLSDHPIFIVNSGLHVKPYTPFFDLGGHSLLALRLLRRLEESFGVELSVSSLGAGGFSKLFTVAR